MIHIKDPHKGNVHASAPSKTPLPEGARIELTSPAQQKSLQQGKIIHSVVQKKLGDGSYQLKTSDGQTVHAKINPDIPVGSKVSFAVISKASSSSSPSTQSTELKLLDIQLPAGRTDTATPSTILATKDGQTNTAQTASQTASQAADQTTMAGKMVSTSTSSAPLSSTGNSIDLKSIEILRLLPQTSTEGVKQMVDILANQTTSALQKTVLSLVEQTSLAQKTAEQSASKEASLFAQTGLKQSATFTGKVTSTLSAEKGQEITLTAVKLVQNPPHQTQTAISSQGSAHSAQQNAQNFTEFTLPKSASLFIRPSTFPLNEGQNISLKITTPDLGEAVQQKGNTLLTASLSTTYMAPTKQNIELNVGTNLPLNLAKNGAKIEGRMLTLANGTKLVLNKTYEGVIAPTKPTIPTQGTAPSPTKEAGQNAALTLQLQGGVKFNLSTPLNIQGETGVAIKITADGMAEVLKVVPHEKGSAGEQYAHLKDPKAPVPRAEVIAKIPFKPDSLHVGIVSAQGQKGLHTLSFADGIKMEITSPKILPLGAHLTIHVTKDSDVHVLNITLPSNAQKVETLTTMSEKWSNLTQGIATLTREKPQLASELMKGIPNIGVNFLASFATFASAVQTAQVHTFSSKEAIATLKGFGIDLDMDIKNLHTLQQKSDNPEQWRALLFPYIEGERSNMQQGSFFWKAQENENEEKSLRFVINMTFTSLGVTQLDGFMHDKTVTFKLRSEKSLTQDEQKELQDVVKETLEKFDMQGSILFEQTSQFTLDPLHEMLKDRPQYKVSI